MTKNKKILLLLTGIIGLSLLIFNSARLESIFNLEWVLIFSKVLFAIGLVCFGLIFLAEDWRKALTKIMVVVWGASLILNLFVTAEYFGNVRRSNLISAYSNVKTCDEMEDKFALDLKNGEIKYFQFGIAFDEELEKKLSNKYDIETFGMGCLVDFKLSCYNILVVNYLKEKFDENSINF